MSMKTFLSHLWDAIKGIFEKAEAEVKQIFLPAVIGALNIGKTIIDDDQADIIGKMAGGAGPEIEDKIRQKLPPILAELKLVNAELATQTPEQIIISVFKDINLSSDKAKNMFYHSISSMLLYDMADGKITWSEAVELVEFYYKNYPQGEQAAAATNG